MLNIFVMQFEDDFSPKYIHATCYKSEIKLNGKQLCLKTAEKGNRMPQHTYCSPQRYSVWPQKRVPERYIPEEQRSQRCEGY